MSDPLSSFPPNRAFALQKLTDFAPRAGRAYGAMRNFDHGVGQHSDVSTLSPYLRMRMLDEITVCRTVLDHNTVQDADKFIAEVFWRTYWKGWMELRPAVWDGYQSDLCQLHNEVQTQSGLRQRWEAACLGQTGIASFDDWAQELAETGYLHNHARMWFASIWIFTLRLPWQLGADFFLRHLLDGDAAVNTLSWRWVAGIQTRGKTYLARAENIARFTQGRYTEVPGLATSAVPVEAPEPPVAQALAPCVPLPLVEHYGILLHSDDVGFDTLTAFAPDPTVVAYADPSALQSPWKMAPHVAAFRKSAARDAVPAGREMAILTSVDAIRTWAKRAGITQIVTPYAPVGPMQHLLRDYQALPDHVPLNLIRRSLDTAAWPLATKGFFPFRKHIPDLIAEFVTT